MDIWEFICTWNDALINCMYQGLWQKYGEEVSLYPQEEVENQEAGKNKS